MSDLPAGKVELLDWMLGESQAQGRIPTVVEGIVRDGRLVWAGSAGDWPEPVATPADHQFRIGSITKTFTAVLLLQARDAGRLDLDASLSTYVAEAPFGDRSIRALLSHTAGVPKEPAGDWWERVDGGSFADLVAAQATAVPMADEGVEFRYSNLAYGLLGEVAARVWGDAWWSLVKARILDPLGMPRTTYLPEAPHALGWSISHLLGTATPEPLTDTGAMAPAGQLWSTLADLATYADFVATGHPEVLALGTLEEASVEQLAESGYGLGFRIVESITGVGHHRIGHTGTMPGFKASFFVDRERREAFVGLANATQGLESLAAAQVNLSLLHNDMLGLPAEGEGPAATPRWRPATDVPADIREIVGGWYWGETAFELRWDSGELRLVELRESDPYEEYTRQDGRWIGTDRTELEVVRRADGSVEHLVSETYVFTRTPYAT